MKNSSFPDLEHLELLARRIAERGVDITSQYQDWIDVTFACATQGEAARDAYHQICRQYPGYSREECDRKFDNCLRTGRGDISIATIVKMAKDAGVDTSLPRGRKPKSEEQKREEQKNVFETATELLHEWAQWWYNEWSNRIELQEPGGVRRPVRDRDLSTYYCRLKEEGIRISVKDVEHLIQSRDFAVDDNPFKRYFDGLPKWNAGDPDYIHEFFVGHMEFNDPENTDFYDRMFHKWFAGLVGLWLGYVDENPIVPVFKGDQHIGKTFFVRRILPPELQSYLFPVNPGARVDKDFEISMSETPLMFLDEFSVNSLQKSEAYKYAATSSKSYLRDSYGHFREMRNRKASLFAATNHEKCIRDVEGNRRWLVVDLKGTQNLDENPLPYEGAYAQALWLLENGFKPKPDRDESEQISLHGQPYVMTDDTTEALQTFVRKPRKGEIPEAYSAGDLLKTLAIYGFTGNRYNSVSIGRAMNSMGFESKKINGKNKYIVVLADPNRQSIERKTDAEEFAKSMENLGIEQGASTSTDTDHQLPF